MTQNKAVYGYGCYGGNAVYGDKDWYKSQLKLDDWPPKGQEETELTKPHIISSGACTAGYLSGIWAATVEQITDVLKRSTGSYGLVFALTGANNKPHNTDKRLVEIGFKEVFQTPNWLHANVPIKLWAINLIEWKEKNSVVKQPRAVASR